MAIQMRLRRQFSALSRPPSLRYSAPEVVLNPPCSTLVEWHTSREVIPGGVVEWFMAPVLKTGRPKGLVGSNPTPSALRQVISER
jgi:hypothetical protein